MTMEPQPLGSVPPSCSDKSCGGGGTRKRVEKEPTVVIEGSKDTIKKRSTSRKLGVKNAEQTQLIRFGRPVLTPSQLIEFQHQSLIFKHMVDGVPVPLHLVIPIWKTVAASFGSDTGAIYRQYPSFVGFTPKEFKYRNMIDPEPGRCRRTDGKKWRCSKNVIPEQKYCERHMHRGRQQRSRKLVEASQESTKNPYHSKANSNHPLQNYPSPPSPLPLTPLPSGNSEKSKNVSTLFQLLTPSSNTSGNDNPTSSVATCNSNSKNGNAKGGTFLSNKSGTTVVSTPAATPIITRNNTSTHKNDVCSGENSFTPISTTNVAAFTTKLFASNSMTPTIQSNYTDTPATAATSTTIVSNNKSIYSVGRKLDGGFSTINNIINRSSKISNNSNITNVSSGLGFSPKSVLQVVGCTASCFYKSEQECEPWRCKRTDGKKWRCSRDILPDQKYCARHMHRGAKRRPPPSQPVFNFSDTPITTLPPRSVTPSIEARSAMPNTNLSISLPPSPQCVTNDDKSGPSYSSDATISDTTITAYENR